MFGVIVLLMIFTYGAGLCWKVRSMLTLLQCKKSSVLILEQSKGL